MVNKRCFFAWDMHAGGARKGYKAGFSEGLMRQDAMRIDPENDFIAAWLSDSDVEADQ